jgi:hypothetical protein
VTGFSKVVRREYLSVDLALAVGLYLSRYGRFFRFLWSFPKLTTVEAPIISALMKEHCARARED